MIELIGREDGAFRDIKVLENVGVFGFKEDLWVAEWEFFVSVDIGVQ